MILLPDTYWEIRNTSKKGLGVFAKKPILKGSVIGDYRGKVLRPQDAIVDENNFYLMYYHDQAVITPDLEKPGVHLLNHSCVPNTFLYIYKGHSLAFTRRNIAGGEEITISYLLSPKDSSCKPCQHICTCGDVSCTKTMHLSKEKYNRWRTFIDVQAKKTKKERIQYGKDLSLLSSYPKKVPTEYIEEINTLFSFPV